MTLAMLGKGDAEAQGIASLDGDGEEVVKIIKLHYRLILSEGPLEIFAYFDDGREGEVIVYYTEYSEV